MSNDLTGPKLVGDTSPDVRSLELSEREIMALAGLDGDDLDTLSGVDRTTLLMVGGVILILSAVTMVIVGAPAIVGAVAFLALTLVLFAVAVEGRGWFVGLLALGSALATAATGAKALEQLGERFASPGSFAVTLVGVTLALCAVAYAGYHAVRALMLRFRRLTRTQRILADVTRFHRVLGALNLSDQLTTARGEVPDAAARCEVLRGLRLTRERLVAALRIDGVLRQHGPLLSGLGAPPIEIGSFETLRVQAEGEQYGRLADETTQLAANIEQGLEEIRRASR